MSSSVSARCASGSVAWVSQPSCVTSTSGWNARTSGSTTASNASSHTARRSAARAARSPRSRVRRPRRPRAPGRCRGRGAARLVQRHREHARVGGEHPLDPVAVVHVDVDVGDALRARSRAARRSRRRVVVDAEPGRAVGHRMVQPAARVERVRTVPSSTRRAASTLAPTTASDASCTPENAGVSPPRARRWPRGRADPSGRPAGACPAPAPRRVPGPCRRSRTCGRAACPRGRCSGALCGVTRTTPGTSASPQASMSPWVSVTRTGARGWSRPKS
jgi:hypothetical protein